jgi:signal transduction histidine kinase
MGPKVLPLTQQQVPEMTAPLVALARLMLRAASVASDAVEGVATALLEELIAACDAQRGALLLTAQQTEAGLPEPASASEDGRAPQRGSAIVRTLAVQRTRQEVAWALIAPDAPEDVGRASVPSAPDWLTYELPIGDHLASHLRAGEMLRLDGAAVRASHAVVVLGWDTPAGGEVVAQARTRLSLLADAVTAVIVNLLLAESGHAMRDVARQREALLHEVQQARTDWEQTFDAVSDPICVVTADYQLVRANATYMTLFGLRRGQLETHQCYSLTQGRKGPCEGCPLPRTIATERPGLMRQERLLPTGPQGALERHVFEVWTYPIVTAEGKVDRVVEILKDVTEREQLAQMASQATALREADRLKAELLGTVSHELRSPLAAIKGYAATLLRHERRLPRAERHEFLQAIGEASDRLNVIIDRLMLLSQLETGAVTLQCAPVDLGRIAREALEAAERFVARREPDRFTFTLRQLDASGRPAQTLPLITADPRRIRDVLDNLLENAVKYSPEGGAIEVTIQPAARDAALNAVQPVDRPAAALAPDRRLLEVRVRDQGRGIPREQLGRIFERFHRVDTRLAREGDGLGVGLTICQRLVALHGGAIWAESAPAPGADGVDGVDGRDGADGGDGADAGDGGSTFHVLLPLAGPAGPAAALGADAARAADDHQAADDHRAADDHHAAAAEATGPSPTGP